MKKSWLQSILGKCFYKTSPDFWLGLQAQHDLEVEEDEFGDRVEGDGKVKVILTMDDGQVCPPKAARLPRTERSAIDIRQHTSVGPI